MCRPDAGVALARGELGSTGGVCNTRQPDRRFKKLLGRQLGSIYLERDRIEPTSTGGAWNTRRILYNAGLYPEVDGPFSTPALVPTPLVAEYAVIFLICVSCWPQASRNLRLDDENRRTSARSLGAPSSPDAPGHLYPSAIPQVRPRPLAAPSRTPDHIDTATAPRQRTTASTIHDARPLRVRLRALLGSGRCVRVASPLSHTRTRTRGRGWAKQWRDARTPPTRASGLRTWWGRGRGHARTTNAAGRERRYTRAPRRRGHGAGGARQARGTTIERTWVEDGMRRGKTLCASPIDPSTETPVLGVSGYRGIGAPGQARIFRLPILQLGVDDMHITKNQSDRVTVMDREQREKNTKTDLNAVDGRGARPHRIGTGTSCERLSGAIVSAGFKFESGEGYMLDGLCDTASSRCVLETGRGGAGMRIRMRLDADASANGAHGNADDTGTAREWRSARTRPTQFPTHRPPRCPPAPTCPRSGLLDPVGACVHMRMHPRAHGDGDGNADADTDAERGIKTRIRDADACEERREEGARDAAVRGTVDSCARGCAAAMAESGAHRDTHAGARGEIRAPVMRRSRLARPCGGTCSGGVRVRAVGVQACFSTAEQRSRGGIFWKEAGRATVGAVVPSARRCVCGVRDGECGKQKPARLCTMGLGAWRVTQQRLGDGAADGDADEADERGARGRTHLGHGGGRGRGHGRWLSSLHSSVMRGRRRAGAGSGLWDSNTAGNDAQAGVPCVCVRSDASVGGGPRRDGDEEVRRWCKGVDRTHTCKSARPSAALILKARASEFAPHRSPVTRVKGGALRCGEDCGVVAAIHVRAVTPRRTRDTAEVARDGR
ncbi:hypothetical protein B0H17DRAFT_1183574 [Mycena rosella]|uniref:Uncharacterized protein n=1 Tax=Mycena rosella TaxID=1033263 RepID=A0AAD7CZY6_MYCRO|nr:hypothetical protein B0H17DRAFT_1183574 [Mycena rosella]